MTGSASVDYSGADSQHLITGSFSGDRSGPWLGLNCTHVANATAEELSTWCLWSPQTDRAAVRALLNKSRDSLDLSAFSGPQGRSDFCYGEAGSAGGYVYTYSGSECITLGLPCADQGVVEEGTYRGVGAAGSALGIALNSTYVYAGAWAASSGPGVGRLGSGLYAAVGDSAGRLTLRGFYCAYDSDGRSEARQAGCFPESYALNGRRAACSDSAGVAGGGWSAELLAAAVVPGLLVALMLAAAAVSACRAMFGKVEDESDRLLRAKMAELRARFRITQPDGFVLSSDPPPAWWRPRYMRAGGVVYLHKSGLEAAARLGLWEDFDIDQVPDPGAASGGAGPASCAERSVGLGSQAVRPPRRRGSVAGQIDGARCTVRGGRGGQRGRPPGLQEAGTGAVGARSPRAERPQTP